ASSHAHPQRRLGETLEKDIAPFAIELIVGGSLIVAFHHFRFQHASHYCSSMKPSMPYLPGARVPRGSSATLIRSHSDLNSGAVFRIRSMNSVLVRYCW